MTGHELKGPNLVQHKTTSGSFGSYIHRHERCGHGLWTWSIITVYDTVIVKVLNYKIHGLQLQVCKTWVGCLESDSTMCSSGRALNFVFKVI